MSKHIRMRPVLVCCALVAMNIAACSHCDAAPFYSYADSELDDSIRTVHFSGMTPFPHIAQAFDASTPSLPDSLALCVPDLYCALDSN